MFRYKLHWADGSEAGEASYAMNINAGDLIWAGDGRKLHVLDVVPVEEEDSPYTGLLRGEAA